MDEQGILHVAAPFCGSLAELPVLAEFLVQRYMTKQLVSAVSIFASDYLDWGARGGYWQQKAKYIPRKHPGMTIEFRTLDLAKETHPSSALIFGIHPECTTQKDESPWPDILSNVFKSTLPGGLCTIATYKYDEMEVVCQICKDAGFDFEMHENPYWLANPLPEGTSPSFLRFLILVRGRDP